MKADRIEDALAALQSKYDAIADFGLRIAERVPLVPPPQHENAAHLTARQAIMGHMLGPQA